jgi:molybdenum cofactor biosynthesis enzyme MoaA
MGSASISSVAATARGKLREGLRRIVQDLRDPRSHERRELCRRRWETLPDELRTPQQAAGRAHVACGATHGVMERCDFACTACYLTPIANRTPKLPFVHVREQLDALRRSLGPMGKVQITSGEVTLLEPDELGRIVAHARQIGLDPMVMTNGQRFKDQPDYLPTLVREYGLRKVAIHVDVTQRGRRGFRAGGSEKSLRHVRDQFATLVRETRRQTGHRLDAAHTVTVTEKNIDEIPEILGWALENHDAFRMVSFQPVAEIGRTRDRRDSEVSLDSVWSKVCETIGRPLNRNALHFGHPACNIVCPLFVVSLGKQYEIVECVPEGDRRALDLLSRLLEAVGGLDPLGANLGRGIIRLTSILARNPGLLASAGIYGLTRAWRQRRLLGSIAASLTLLRPVRVRPWALVVHSFMNREELSTPLGRERLDACVFRVSVDGRMVSMCELNATDLRLRLNLEQGVNHGEALLDPARFSTCMPSRGSSAEDPRRRPALPTDGTAPAPSRRSHGSVRRTARSGGTS